jgi:hypothetical protein
MAQSNVTPPAPGTPLPPPASDLDVQRVVLMTLGVLSASAIAFIAMTLLINLYTEMTPDFILPTNINNLEAKVSAEDLKNRNDFLQSSRQSLGSYGWADPDQRVVRIPIDRAIDLTVQRGLPVRPNVPGTSQGQVLGQHFSGDTNSGRSIEALRK